MTSTGIREAALILCVGALSVGASFNVAEIHLDRPDAHVFLAQGISASPMIVVLDGYTLRLYINGPDSPPTTITLPPGATAMDISDTDDDGTPEVVVVVGAEIHQFELSGDSPPSHAVLFSLNSVLRASSPRPYPRVIVTRVEDTTVLALPTAEALELRSPLGELIARHPWADDGMDGGFTAASFSARAYRPNQAGQPGTLELRLTSTANPTPQALGQETPEARLSRSRTGTPLQARDAALRSLSAWPWFPLHAEIDNPARVFFAFDPPGFTDTLLRISMAGNVAESEASPLRRRYAGTLVLPDGITPDLNADGFSDIVLWSAPRPGQSVQALLRVASEHDWPVRITAHLFAVGKNRHDPRPSGSLTFRAPLAWFLKREWGAPVRNFRFLDVDGDGASEIGVSTGPKKFGVWRYAEGLKNEPDYDATFPDDITGIEILKKANPETGADLIALRSSGNLYILSIP
jgi:hypothetical protein